MRGFLIAMAAGFFAVLLILKIMVNAEALTLAPIAALYLWSLKAVLSRPLGLSEQAEKLARRKR